MISLPAITLSDECEVITKGTTPTTLGFRFEANGVPFIRAQNLVDGTVSIDADPLYISFATHNALRRSHIMPEDVLISIAGTIGRAAIVPSDAGPMNCNQAVAIVRPSKRIDRRFLLHWLSTKEAVDQIARGKVTATISNLSLGEIGSLKIPLPPLSDQHRIVAILDKANELRRKRERAVDLLDHLTQSIFLDMSKKVSTTTAPVSTFARVQGGKRVPKGHEYDDEETGYKYLRVVDMQKEDLRRSDLRNLKAESYEAISRYTVSEGDIVISIAGTIGVTRYVDAELDGVNLTENAAKIVLHDRNAVDPIYLDHALKSELLQKQIRAVTGQVTIGKLALFRIEKLEVPLPHISAQRRFALQITKHKEMRRAVTEAVSSAERLFSSLQHRAFSGQL